jgi:hypothetical protein
MCLTIVTIATIFVSSNYTGHASEIQYKGLFTIQFSWNSQSFSSKNSVEIQYKKAGLLKKSKLSAGGMPITPKNTVLSMQLSAGEYEFQALRLVGPDFGYGKYLNIPFEKTFVIKPGQVTNGGLFFIGKEDKSSNDIMYLVIDNDNDIERYVNIHYKGEVNTPITINRAWEFLKKDKINSINEAYTAKLIESESKKARPKVTLLYTTLGIVLRMKKDSEGKVLDYSIIKTPSYQEIVGMKVLGKNLLCTLGNGDHWYGTNEEIDYMPYPSEIEKYGKLYSLGGEKFLMVDSNFNIHYTAEAFDWQSQNEFEVERKYGLLKDEDYSIPSLYFGKDNMYIFSKSSGKYRLLLRSAYEEVNFTEVPLTKDVKQVPMVTETEKQLILGPDLKTFASAKRPAYLYVQDHGTDIWRVVDLPRGDCNRFGVDSKNGYRYSVTCGGEVTYHSLDNGSTWEEQSSTKK